MAAEKIGNREFPFPPPDEVRKNFSPEILFLVTFSKSEFREYFQCGVFFFCPESQQE